MTAEAKISNEELTKEMKNLTEKHYVSCVVCYLIAGSFCLFITQFLTAHWCSGWVAVDGFIALAIDAKLQS